MFYINIPLQTKTCNSHGYFHGRERSKRMKERMKAMKKIKNKNDVKVESLKNNVKIELTKAKRVKGQTLRITFPSILNNKFIVIIIKKFIIGIY